MSTRVGDIFVNLKLDRSEYDKGLKGLESTAGKIGASIAKKLSLGFAVAGLAKFAKQCTEAGASLNAMGTIIDASLPHMTKQVDDFAKSAGSAFGLSQTQAKEFVGKFASMAHAMGYTEKQAYDMSTSLAGLAGDIASYYHISQDEAFSKLGAVFTGETESLKSLGVVMTQNALQSFAMSQGIQKSWTQMSELEKTSLRYQFILNSLSLAQGDFAKYSTTWSGSLATIRLNWQNFMATVGQGLINILLPLMQVIAKLSNVLTWLGNKFLWLTRLITGKDAEVGASLDATFGADTQGMLGDASVSLDNVGGNVGGIGNTAKKAKKQVQALKRELAGFDKITKLTGKADAATGTSGVSGIGGSGGGVGDIGNLDDIDSVMPKLEIPQTTTDSWSGWKQVVGDALDLLLTAGKSVIDDVLSPMIGLVTKHIAPLAVDLIGTALKNILDIATSFPKWLMDLFSNGDKTVTIDVDDKFSKKWEEIKALSDVALTVSVGLQKNFGSNNNTVADWIVNSRLLGDLKIYVGLDQSFGTVKNWIVNNRLIGGDIGMSISLPKLFTGNYKSVLEWILKNSLLGGDIPMAIQLGQTFGTVALWLTNNKLIGGIANTGEKVADGVIKFGVKLGQSFGEGVKTVADWLGLPKNSGGSLEKGIELTPNFGEKGKKKKKSKITTVADWLRYKAWGKNPKHGVGLTNSFGNKKVKHVSTWLQWYHWGSNPEHGVGLKPAFYHNGKKYDTVTSWLSSYMTKGAELVVKIAGQTVSGDEHEGATGGIYTHGTWKPIQKYAGGGILGTHGQMFIAREKGPELVGTLGGHTAIMNNNQIVASVSSGVAKAMAGIRFKMTAPRIASTGTAPTPAPASVQEAPDNSQMITLLTQILTAIKTQDNNVYLDGEQIKNNVVKRINNHTRQTGQFELVI